MKHILQSISLKDIEIKVGLTQKNTILRLRIFRWDACGYIGRHWKIMGGRSWKRSKILEKKQDLGGKKDLGMRRRILEDGGRRILDEHGRRRIPRAPSYQEAHFPSLVAA